MNKRSILISVFSLSILAACANDVALKKVEIVDNYVIEIPADFTVHELLSSPVTSVPIYMVEAPDGSVFDLAVHPYAVSSNPIPGTCVVSAEFDAGETSAPVYCEGLSLTSSFTVPAGWDVKYGSAINDLTLASCTMNSPCPVEVPPESRYSITYVFVIPDKSNNIILEFYAGDMFRGPSDEIDGFQGLGFVLHDLIIPSLSAINP